jgi:putative hydrolase of the HAD superfamily
MHKPLGVIFDFGGTVLSHGVIDVIGGNRRLYELAVNKNGVGFDDVRRSVEKVTDWIEPLKNSSMVELTCESLNRLIYDPLGLTFALTPAELEKEFWRASLKYSPVPGIYDLLDLLDLHDIKTGILSNSMYRAAMQAEELAAHNLAHRFSFIITSADYGVRKPHPFIFAVAVKKIDLIPDDIWFVGDTPGQDIKGALDADLYPVWLNRGNEPRALDGDYLVVGSLDELRKVIAKLV